MKTFNITLDGRIIAVKQGDTLLDAARGAGIDIPALCYDPRLPPYAACFICIVEVEGRRGMAPACATKAEEGMKVRTSTENIVRLRKLGLELLLSNHHGDCVAPCNMACPAGIDIRSYLSEAARGNYNEALRIIKESNPFPSVCGRICPHPCEDNCRRRLVDSAVSINQVKRFISDRDRASLKPWLPATQPKNGRKAAVIGGGPGGMSAAHYLAVLGYSVTVFEAMPKAGGMLRYGVPDYRLPPEVLDAEIESILSLGVELRVGHEWGKDFHLADLRKQGFSAIIVAVGAWSGMPMGVEGEDRPGVWSGIAMLEKANKGERPDLGRRVLVVGGGNTAMDCARTALRLGAGEVSVVYRRGLTEMPANPEDIEEARDEGVKFYFLTAPAGFPGEGKISAMRCVKMELGEPDTSGRRKPIPVPGSETDIPADSVIAAIGQKVRWDGFDSDGLKLTKWGTPQTDPATLEAVGQTDVYVCGDCLTGPATAIEAIAGGRMAALSAHNKLSGAKEPIIPHPFNIRKGKLADLDPRDYDNYPKKERAKVPQLPPAARARVYDEVSQTLTEEAVLAEADRCLRCGCREVSTCLLRRYAEQYGAKGEEFKGEKTPANDIPDHPYIVRDQQKCIMCGRCVRVCAELRGSGAIGLMGRGFSAQIAPPWAGSLQKAECKSCGQCIATCPTGALSAKLKDERIPAWRAEERNATCPYCGAGCILTVAVADGKIQRVSNKMGASGEDNIICSKGFTGFDLLEAGDRLLEPMIKEKNGWRKADWNSALKTAADGLKKAAAEGGPKSAAVLGSPRLTNEALYLLQKIARAGLGTNHIGPGMGGGSDMPARSLGLNVSTAAREDIAASDFILVAGSDLEADHAGIASLIRRAVASGARLQVHSPGPTGLDRHADILRAGYPDTYHIYTRWLTELLREGAGLDTVDGLPALRASLSRAKPPAKLPGDAGAQEARLGKAFLNARRPLVILDPLRVHPGELAALLDILLIKDAVGKPGAGLLLLRAASNAQGALDQGLDGRRLPGHLPVTDAAARARFEKSWGHTLPDWPGMNAAGILDAARAGSVKALLSWGDNGLEGLTSPGTFVVSGEWTVPSPEHPASVVFPAALFSEDSGSLTSFDRRVSQAGGWSAKLSPKPNWAVLTELAGLLGLGQDTDIALLRREISGVNRLYEKLGWDKWGDNTITESWQFGPAPLFHDGNFATKSGKAELLIPSEEETRESLQFFNYLAGEDMLERFIRARLKKIRSCGRN